MVYILMFVILIVCELGYLKLAAHWKLLDVPNARSSHTAATLVGGGVIIPVAVWLWGVFFGLEYLWFVMGLTLIAAVSLMDDIHPLTNRIRLAAQLVAAALMMFDLGIYDMEWWWTPITAFVIMGIVNIYNFMDGINGMSGGYTLTVLVALVWMNLTAHFIEDSMLISAALGVVVFLWFNFRKRAKCFAGDSGAVSMGYIVTFALLRLIIATGNPVYMLFLSVYGADGVLTILHRIKLRENIGRAHRKHAFQMMSNELKVPQLVVSTCYALLQLTISMGLMLLLPRLQWWYFGGVIVFLTIGYVAFMNKYYYHKAYMRNAINQSPEN